MRKNKIVIGTRGSKLALWQAEWIQSGLKQLYPGLEVGMVKIKTTGDKILDVPLAQVGGKGLFVKEIEEALLRNEVDIAVHSMKDVPTELPGGLHLAVVCKREDPRDALILSKKVNVKGEKGKRRKTAQSLIFTLPKRSVIGTSSLRRSCQLLHIRPDVRIAQLRGNLDTRLRKLDEGLFDAIILASAGVKRLGLQDRISEILLPEISLPAIGQGAVGIECRSADTAVNVLIAPLNHPETSLCVKAERAFLKKLEGGCQVPIAAHARLEQRGRRDIRSADLVIDGLVGTINGNRLIKGHREGKPEEAEELGTSLAEDILSQGAREILNAFYSSGNAPVKGRGSS